MPKLILALVFLAIVISTKSYAQESTDFQDYARIEKNKLLKAYADKDIPGYKKQLNDLTGRYNKLGDKEKKNYKWNVSEAYHIMADMYALSGDKKNAMYFLKKSEPNDYDDVAEDADLAILKKEPEFIKLLYDVKNRKSDVQLTLQDAQKYNVNEKDILPVFTYEESTDKELASLKAFWNLDSVAGKGNDISKIINLMEWVHYLVPHDGSKGNPEVKNAMSLINECKREHKTLNCRGLAIVLNEVYLAEGFKSRYVTCMPKDTADNDCHVITTVWSTSLKKWVWIGPTFMAYVMDENGSLLSIAEVRERLITGQPLILNPDANRNHAASQTKSDYLGWYMSKNLYKIECPLNSRYNYETPEDAKTITYVQLVPGNIHPAKTKQDRHGVSGHTVYYTNNPVSFWAAPFIENLQEAKSKGDYEQVMGLFKKYYNQERSDSIVSLISYQWGEQRKSAFNKAELDRLMKDYGNMISYSYAGRDDGDGDHDVALFKMVFDKSVHMMGISLDKDNKMLTYRFATSSIYIDKLLATTQ